MAIKNYGEEVFVYTVKRKVCPLANGVAEVLSFSVGLPFFILFLNCKVGQRFSGWTSKDRPKPLGCTTFSRFETSFEELPSVVLVLSSSQFVGAVL